MSRAKLLVVAAFVVFALSVPATASANKGGHFFVNGILLASGVTKELLPTALVLNVGELKVLLAEFAVKCTAHEIGIAGGKIIGTDGILASSITFNKCAGSGACTELGSEKIETVPIHGLVELDLASEHPLLDAYVLLLPETKTVFATINFTGATCALKGVQPVTGDASLLIHEASHEKLLHLVLAFSLPHTLKVGSDEADLKDLHFDIALKSHENWSFL